MEALTRREAQRIITQLKSGTPPSPRTAYYLNVGRERWIDGMAWYLDAARDDELSALRLIIGDYGTGKTHFQRVTQYLAHERNFVVSGVTASKEAPLDRFDVIWAQILHNIVLDPGADPSSDERERSGFEDLLNEWCQRVVENDSLTEELAALNRLRHVDPDFRKAVAGYLQAWVTEDDPTIYLQWFKGGAVRLRYVRSRIDRTSARAMLRSLVYFLRHIGYSGLLLYFDELELVAEQTKRIRDTAYETLRQFIDGTDNIPSFLVLCAVTETAYYDHQKGILSYPALQQRLGSFLGTLSERDYRALTINLNRIPLTETDLFELGRRIRAVHAVAFDWNAEEHVSDGVLREFAAEAISTSEVSPPRFLVQLVVTVLERLQQNPEFSVDDVRPTRSEIVGSVRAAERARYQSWEEHDVESRY